jgi:2-dehydropantoate 2-reductase
MRIVVVGAGAIGGYTAAVLARAGTPVAVVARGAHLDAILRYGITILSSDVGAFSVPVEASDDLRKLGAFDIALLTFKAHQWPALLPQLEAAAAAGTTVVTLQNGVPFWFRRDPPLQTVDPGGAIGALFHDDRTIGGVVHISGHIAEPGKIRQSGGGRFIMHALDPDGDDLVTELAARMRDAGLAPEIEENIRRVVWLKLINNTGLNPVSTLRRLTVHRMLEDPVAREEVRDLMLETIAVGRALGVVGDVDVDARIAYARHIADVQTSMLQDSLANRPLELDPIVGAVIELAEGVGMPVPHLRAVYNELRSQIATSS